MIDKIGYLLSRAISRKPSAKKNSKIDKTAAVGNGAQIVNSTIGRYTYIFESKLINTDVGSFCSIAADCTIGGGSHPTNWVSTSPVFYNGKNCLKKNFSNNVYDEFQRTIIENDVWIGSKCLIKSGVKIGNGAIVGMGSVVTHDILPYEIWAGNPAKKIRNRFSDNIIEELCKNKWWEMDDETLVQLGKYFNNPELFLKCLEERK